MSTRSWISILALALMVALAIESSKACAQIATWYGARCDSGQKRHICDPDGDEYGSPTANGERFDPDGFCADYPQSSCTCAHRTLPFGTYLRVSLRGRVVVCRINDRGPNKSTGADIDLSYSAARQLGMLGDGRVRVSTERMGRLE